MTMFRSERDPAVARCAALMAGLAVGLVSMPACAESRLDARYEVTLAGLPIGQGSWTIDLGADRYSMTAKGEVTGLLRAFAGGDGSASVRGAVHRGRLYPSSYALSIRSSSKVDQVKMALAGGAVKSISIAPPPKPSTTRVPLAEAHKRGVLDPITAGLVPEGKTAKPGPEACDRTLPVFDGRQRYDLALSFKRMEKVKARKGYSGPAVVCAVSYRPVSGHDREKFAVRFLRNSKDIEMWFVPLDGSHFLAVYRVSIPTLLGTAVMQATRFVASSRAARPALSPSRTH